MSCRHYHHTPPQWPPLLQGSQTAGWRLASAFRLLFMLSPHMSSSNPMALEIPLGWWLPSHYLLLFPFFWPQTPTIKSFLFGYLKGNSNSNQEFQNTAPDFPINLLLPGFPYFRKWCHGSHIVAQVQDPNDSLFFSLFILFISKSCWRYHHDLSWIWPLPATSTATTLTQATVISCLDHKMLQAGFSEPLRPSKCNQSDCYKLSLILSHFRL